MASAWLCTHILNIRQIARHPEKLSQALQGEEFLGWSDRKEKLQPGAHRVSGSGGIVPAFNFDLKTGRVAGSLRPAVNNA
jgi:hypothetical protein